MSETKLHKVTKFTDICAVGDLKSVSLDSTSENIEFSGNKISFFFLSQDPVLIKF